RPPGARSLARLLRARRMGIRVSGTRLRRDVDRRRLVVAVLVYLLHQGRDARFEAIEHGLRVEAEEQRQSQQRRDRADLAEADVTGRGVLLVGLTGERA